MPNEVNCAADMTGTEWEAAKVYERGAVVRDSTQLDADGNPKRFILMGCDQSVPGERPSW